MKLQYLQEEIVKDSQHSRMREAENYRLVRTAVGNRPGIASRFLVGVGRWMVAEGIRLQTRYEAANNHLKRQNAPTADVYYLANR